MTSNLCRISCLVAIMSLIDAGTVWASRPAGGTTYRGHTKSTGLGTESAVSVVLTVSQSGDAVTLKASTPPFFCPGKVFILPPGGKELTRPAAISQSGSFSGSITYTGFVDGQSMRLRINGQFSGRTVKGTARLKDPLLNGECEGSTSFSAKAK